MKTTLFAVAISIALPLYIEVLRAFPSADPMFPAGREHDFGDVPHGEIVKHDFPIVNTSDVDLTIQSVRASVGAVCASVDKKVLKPNERGHLKVSVETIRFLGPKTTAAFLTYQIGEKVETVEFQVSVNSK